MLLTLAALLLWRWPWARSGPTGMRQAAVVSAVRAGRRRGTLRWVVQNLHTVAIWAITHDLTAMPPNSPR